MLSVINCNFQRQELVIPNYKERIKNLVGLEVELAQARLQNRLESTVHELC